MTREAFPTDISIKDILETQDIAAIKERFDYTVRLGAIATVTGEVGSGKSTALRHVVSKLHPSEYKTLWITACSGSILEFYRLFLAEFGIHMAGSQKAIMIRLIKKAVREVILEKKMKIVLIVDEASLMRLEVFAELHTITVFEQDSKPWLPIILTGRSNLIDKLMYQTSLPLASRIVARSHMEPVDRQEMEQYLLHHLALTGVKSGIFNDAAVTAIHQGSGGIFRKANHLARGALVAAANAQSTAVSADHVRLAATEIF
jgi:type II secretory pathway predicted ATPase ExeA